MTIKKPQLAEDIAIEAVTFPCWAQPKIDGVRAMNITGTLTGRSLDPFKGFGITEYFSTREFQFLDGEMIVGNVPNSMDRLCSITSGAMGRFKDTTEMADLHWFAFDYLEFPGDMYKDRYQRLKHRLLSIDHPRVHLVPYEVVNTVAELQFVIAKHLAAGYEGTITRNPNAVAKPGRSTLKGQELWRFKPWGDAEIFVTGITEGNKNANEAKKNSLGRTERSSAAAGLVPNGMIGSIQGTLTKDYVDPITGKTLFLKGLPCTIAPGAMTDPEAKDLLKNPHKILGHFVKFQHMTHGVKDQPRFGGYLSHRLAEDMS